MRRAQPSLGSLACAVSLSGCALAHATPALRETYITASGCVPQGLDATAVIVGLESLRAGEAMPDDLRAEMIAVAECLGEDRR